MDAFYDWKQDVLPTSLSQRQQLNHSLATLAWQAMRQTPPIFRLSTDFASQQLDPEQLTLALQLGWLQPLGWSQTTGEKVYAFYHATFQEYFAAQAVSDWQQLVELQTETETLHPIFISQWQEVVLLWLGRSDVAATDKTQLLQTLVDFADGCGGFYDTQAKLLATKGLAEFPSFSGRHELLKQVIHWRFDQQKTKPAVWVSLAGEALAHSDHTLVIQALETYLKATPHPFAQWLAAHSLGKRYDPGNSVALATLETLLPQIPKLDLQIEMAKNLADVQPGHPLALQTLQQIMQSEISLATRRKAAHRLGKIDPGNDTALQVLVKILQETEDPLVQRQTLTSLQQLAPDHPITLASDCGPRTLQANSLPKSTHRRAHHSKKQLSDQQLIPILEQKLRTSKDATTRIRHAGRLGQFSPHHPDAVAVLLHYLGTSTRKAQLKHASDHLRDMMSGDDCSQDLSVAIAKTLPQVQAIFLSASHPAQYQAAYKLLWH